MRAQVIAPQSTGIRAALARPMLIDAGKPDGAKALLLKDESEEDDGA